MTATSAEHTAPGAVHRSNQPDRIDPSTLEQAALTALEQGNLALAELAFLKLSVARPSAAAFARLYDVAAARTNLHLAQSALEALADIEPNNARALERLADLRGRTGDNAGAVEALRRALLIEPTNAALATWHAIWNQGCLDRFHEVPTLLNKAAALDTDGSQLEQIVDVLIYQQHYQDAEHLIGLFQERTGSLHPRMLRYLAVALAGQDRPEEAREVFAVAIAQCDSVLDDKAPSADAWRAMDDQEFRRLCELYAFRARLEHEAGRTSSALTTYAILRTAAEARGLSYPDTLVPDTAARLEDLRNLVAGRDMVLLCQGHSLQDFAARIGELGDRAPAFASLNRFGVVEHEVLASVHRGLDVVVEVTPGSIKRNRSHLKKFLQQSRKTMAIVSPNALRAAFDPEDREAFIAVNGRQLVGAAGNGLHSVTPYDPLGMIQENTLLAAIPLLIAAKPKRLFVIGADQKLAEGDTPSHFGMSSSQFAARTSADFVTNGQSALERDNFDATMRNDAAICDRDLAFQIAAVAALHGFDAPPVFNVSPDSRLQSLSKITLDDFFAMVE